jgi:hypothetical protein
MLFSNSLRLETDRGLTTVVSGRFVINRAAFCEESERGLFKLVSGLLWIGIRDAVGDNNDRVGLFIWIILNRKRNKRSELQFKQLFVEKEEKKRENFSLPQTFSLCISDNILKNEHRHPYNIPFLFLSLNSLSYSFASLLQLIEKNSQNWLSRCMLSCTIKKTYAAVGFFTRQGEIMSLLKKSNKREIHEQYYDYWTFSVCVYFFYYSNQVLFLKSRKFYQSIRSCHALSFSFFPDLYIMT